MKVELETKLQLRVSTTLSARSGVATNHKCKRRRLLLLPWEGFMIESFLVFTVILAY